MKKITWLSLACILAISLVAEANNLTSNSKSAQITKISKANSVTVPRLLPAQPISAPAQAAATPAQVKAIPTKTIAATKKIVDDEKKVPGGHVSGYKYQPNTTLTDFLTEDFEGTFPPSTWTQEITNASYTWQPYASFPYSGSYSAQVLYDYNQYERMVSPTLNFGTASTGLHVSFWWYASYYWMVTPYNNGNLELWISTNGGSTWSDLLWGEDSVGTFTSWTYYQADINLDAYIGQTNVKLSWLYDANDAAEVGLDLVQISDAPVVRPPNDDCVDVTPVPLNSGVPLAFSGDNTNASNDCDSLGSAQVWEAFTTTQALNIMIDYCGTSPVWGNAYGLLVSGCPCGEIFDYTSVDTCTDGNFTIEFENIPAGTYYYPVILDPANSAIGPYTIHVNASPYVAPPVDYFITLPAGLPYNDLGKTTCGMTNDFSNTCLDYYDSGPDAIYQITLTTPTCLEFILNADSSYAGMALDGQYPIDRNNCIAIATSTAVGTLFIPGQNLAAGTYYLMVDNWAPGPDCIDYDLQIRECAPAPANDLCGSVTPVSLPVNTPITFTGNNIGALNDCDSMSYPQVWEAFTTIETLNVTVDYCGSTGFTNFYLGLVGACPCANFMGYYSYDFTTCPDTTITINYRNVPPGTYYIPILYSPVGSTDPAAGPYTIHVVGVTPPPPPPNLCETSLYSNGAATGYAMASQCNTTDPAGYNFVAGIADDFILPGTGNVEIDTVIAYFGFWNGAIDPSGVTGVVVTIYADNGDYPAGQPIDLDLNCAHEELVPGGIITSEVIPLGSYTYGELSPGVFQFAIPITPITLTAGTKYWLEVAPVLSYYNYGQCGWIYTNTVTGSGAMQIFAQLAPPISIYTPIDPAVDMAFCLKGPSAPACAYMLGDINHNHVVQASDVTFLVRYFKGSITNTPPDSCYDARVIRPANPGWLYVAADVNGNCQVQASDVTRLVSYFKGTSVLQNCAYFPPPLARPTPILKQELGQ